jgi:CBS domain containing-hemolysin-like protein
MTFLFLLNTAALFILLLLVSAMNTLTSVSLRRLAEDGDGSPEIRHYLEHRVSYRITLVLCVVLLSAAAAALGVPGLAAPEGLAQAAWDLLGAMVLLALLTLGAQILAASWPEALVRGLLPILRALVFTVGLVSLPLEALVDRRLKARRDRRDAGEEEKDRDEDIATIIGVGETEGILEKEESALIKGVMEFGATVAREVMTPRTDMVCAEASTSLSAAGDILARSRHTRLPLYEGQVDNVVGVAYLKDFLGPLQAGEGSKQVRETMRPVPFVPENKPISDLLREFQKDRVQLAIVVDEYGGVAGLVTTEDLLEEIVGEIQEADEAEQAPFLEGTDGSLEILGRASVDDLAERLGVEIQEGDFDSVAGWISTALGTIPHSGQTLELDGFKVEILSADKKRIHKVRVRRLGGASREPVVGKDKEDLNNK